VYQCAGGLACEPQRIRAITLTASGGPFRTRSLTSFDAITPAEACKHPTWSMGRKISVDSATLMNKGLEVIEAALLFGRSGADIHVVIHPTSTVHALVEFVDGSVLAHLGPVDMQVPIAHALGLPTRLAINLPRLSLQQMGRLEFFDVDADRYPALSLAYQALHAGQSACLVMNAANEVAVAAFLAEQIRFTDIVPLVDHSLQACARFEPRTLDDVFALDAAARSFASATLRERMVSV
jgi:1-deoxy-D-xylulose-5-phosphate reductoisomerase